MAETSDESLSAQALVIARSDALFDGFASYDSLPRVRRERYLSRSLTAARALASAGFAVSSPPSAQVAFGGDDLEDEE